MAANSESLGVFQPPAIRIDEPVETGAISATAVSGSSAGDSPAPVYFSLRPSGTVLPATFPVVVTEGFLDATTTQIGDTISLPALRLPIDTAEIVGSIDEFPTVEPGSAEVLLMDLPTMQMMAYEPGVDPIQPSEYWLDVTGPPDAVVAALHAEPFESFSITARQDRANSLKADPIALGTIASLSLGFIAAAVFAAVGFAVSATVSARERITEFALLRALGLSNRQLGSWLAIEQGALVVVSLVIGTVVGVLLCIVVLPLVAISQAGESVIPALRVIVPYGDIVLLESIVIGTLIVIVVVLALLLRRLGLGSLLRMGED
jgi:predicted lysophospholipase L1 biosynthesis ABC-type transport system permease subunit